ncbi:sn-glycerol-3-phosphate ABC transporter substrate-binding protein UgpB [Roseinatronobacter bogoriensis]|uniref:sn-glycerol-3-phosphate-binding periplasmic protein UgpB n=1 Tax=Roseinatronobacter bogoriensis subsp. barguzinensis TaxID=441209 RepID=A0A2K8KFH7_9RHOB|nr:MULTISPECIES: sn-glycerol-3-phosphate ABC transporter substrate-binding protein UgpB [Rhodobaca]ATX66515.1 sn-glycerol-3-phosphate ABC transporter substrate-binding protein UgpB [Rhodobaca barguzinensis]MBB4207678.1 sn-glycerol 3-phosphate transport system substrate-binding protein [Rhodobaca bogoriensis DSM 18756]TDW40015.1 carbohydrate ABC transporter substrate-binding protein (CUT1 family) [Rhodobaca barguzinensis]TDY70832.1 carbohydrate ABC transporter substrate-binding protein (CUT1 fam
MKKHVYGACLAASTALSPVLANAQVTIEWWHALGGELGELLEGVAEGFNASQSDFVVRPSFRGTYTETMTGAIAAFRANQQPHIVQVFEVGTGTMMAAEGAIYPIYQLMEDKGVPFDPEAYLPAVVSYYTDPNGNMLSFPFNSSTPIMYYNKDVFEAAGLDPETPPATWADVEAASIAILESGAAPCGFTTSWPSWVMLENFSAWHNIPLGTLANGFEGFETEFVFNNELVARHWDNLKAWQDAGAFRWGGPGPGPDAFPAFYAGECAIVFGSSASRAGVLRNTDFNVGFGFQPHYDDVEGAPQNSVIGGATLWVLTGKSDEEYEGVARFFEYLSQPEVQAEWHQDTGYLPITQASFDLTREQGYYDENPGADTSILQMTLNEPTENSRGLRFGNFVQIRDVISEEMEAVMTGAKTGEQATNDAVRRGNDLLRQFEAGLN